ncbi:MAG TPA: CHASE domain-containing protein, partial [Pyrinomonadaceae bacterium]
MAPPKSGPFKSKTILRPRKGRALLPFLILALGLLFTFLVSFYFSRMADDQDQNRFKNSVHQVDERIRARIQTSIALLRAGTGLFAASDNVKATEFQKFVQQIELQKNYPGIQGMGFSRKFSPQEKDAVIASIKSAGHPDFKLWPEHGGDEHHAIIYLEPKDPRNEAAIGYDMFENTVRRAAMEAARDSGEPVASGKVVLVQEIDSEQQAGFLIYAPVYRNNVPIETVDQRQSALLGFVYSPFRADDFLVPVFHEQTISFQVYDGLEVKPEALLFTSSPSPVSNSEPHFTSKVNHPVAGRPWTVTYATTPSFDLTSSRTFLPYTFTAGVLISWLFFAVTRAEVRARTVAETFAAELQSSEFTIRQTLAERQQAQQALIESEEKYRELVENANDIVYMLDLDGKILSINKAAEMITGYTQEELLGHNIREILTPESTAAAQQMLDRKLADAERDNYELDVICWDGNTLPLEVSSKLIQIGTDVAVHGIARDISSRRRAEEALRKADQRALSEYERLLERIANLSQVLGTARELNSIFRGLRDFTKASVPCDGFFVSLYDQTADVRTACYGWGDNEEVDVSDLPPMSVTPGGGPNSQAVLTGNVIITDDYMRATEGHPSVIVGPDNGLRPQSSMAVPMAVMGRIIGTIEVQSYRPAAYRQEHSTAMTMAANLTAVAIQNVRLLKREKAAREAAEESNRLKDEFLATVSHEVRTPLTAILGWARLLESGGLDEQGSRQAIETIWRNAKSQAQIIDDILDVSRIITGHLSLDLHPIEVVPVVEAAIAVMRPTAEAKNIKIATTLDQRPLVVSGDANRLQQVVWNLLSNAVKFTKAGGRVDLSVRQVESGVEIRVADTGQGIKRDFLPFVFDRFRQADSTTTRQHGGLGLGLAIARHLVEIHGGSIKADSDGEGKGASFSVHLPLIDSGVKVTDDEARNGGSIVTPETLAGLRVLVVDDDADTLRLMTTALTRKHATVTAVSSAGEALKAVKTNKPDVLISDIAMPDEDGYGLIRKIRALDDELQSLPAVAITAYAKEEDRNRALSSGFQVYL